MPRFIYKVYVVELSKRVFTENAKFRAANPQFNGVLECLYVGMTSKTPAERLRQHKTGYINKKGHKISANIVQQYGRYLRPSLYDHINAKPMSRQEALLMEEKLASHLRNKDMPPGLIECPPSRSFNYSSGNAENSMHTGHILSMINVKGLH